MKFDYEALLDQAKKELPETVQETSRFEIMKVRGHVEGNKTIISNFVQIADSLHRNPKHLLKYIEKLKAFRDELGYQHGLFIRFKAGSENIGIEEMNWLY